MMGTYAPVSNIRKLCKLYMKDVTLVSENTFHLKLNDCLNVPDIRKHFILFVSIEIF